MKESPARPTLSVVIINWNTRDMLRECLHSVLASLDGMESEIIVVDNASEDGSVQMVSREFPQIHLICNPRNMGFAAANNQAFAISRGQHILMLNSDTIVHPGVLGASVRFLQENPKAGAMGCRVLNPDGSMQRTCSMFPSLANLVLWATGLWRLPWPRFLGRYEMIHWQRNSLREVEVITGCYLMITRQALEETGPLDEDFFFFGEETDWCRRAREKAWKLYFAPVGEITHIGSGSVRVFNSEYGIMLMQALVRLHLKKSGKLAAMAAWLIVMAMNSFRAGFWSVATPFIGPKARKRAAYHGGILRGSRKIWPAYQTGK